MTTVNDIRPLPRSIRKHIRREKARLRSVLSPAEARRTIDQLLRRLRSERGLDATRPKGTVD